MQNNNYHYKRRKELHQSLVNTLNNQINPNILRKEKVKQLRIERKIKKSKNANYM